MSSQPRGQGAQETEHQNLAGVPLGEDKYLQDGFRQVDNFSYIKPAWMLESYAHISKFIGPAPLTPDHHESDFLTPKEFSGSKKFSSVIPRSTKFIVKFSINE